jgi:hypothetical protein
MITLSLVTSENWFSRAIRNITWSPVSHIDIVVPPKTFPDYPEGGYLGALCDGGVKLRPWNYYKNLTHRFVGTVDCDDVVTNKVLQFAYNQIGKPYDYSAILGILIHRDIYNPDAWICSELVAAAFYDADWPLLNLSKVNRVSPGMLLISPRIQYDCGVPYVRV